MDFNKGLCSGGINLYNFIRIQLPEPPSYLRLNVLFIGYKGIYSPTPLYLIPARRKMAETHTMRGIEPICVGCKGLQDTENFSGRKKI